MGLTLNRFIFEPQNTGLTFVLNEGSPPIACTSLIAIAIAVNALFSESAISLEIICKWLKHNLFQQASVDTPSSKSAVSN